jgi:hypothetical protein
MAKLFLEGLTWVVAINGKTWLRTTDHAHAKSGYDFYQKHRHCDGFKVAGR